MRWGREGVSRGNDFIEISFCGLEIQNFMSLFSFSFKINDVAATCGSRASLDRPQWLLKTSNKHGKETTEVLKIGIIINAVFRFFLIE